jgi:parallel beta-helix repeat protein
MPFTPYMMENFTMRDCILNVGTIELRNVDHFYFMNNSLKDTTLDLQSFAECVIWENSFIGGGIYFLGRMENFDDVEIPINNTLNGLPILYSCNKDYMNSSIGDGYGQIIMGNVSNLRMLDIFMSDIEYPILLSYCSSVDTDNVDIRKAITGISTQYCDNLRITNSTLMNSKNHGIFMISTVDSLIMDNYFDRCPVGIFFRWNSRSLKITDNTISNSTSYGIVISDRVFNSLVHGNILKYNDVGIYFNDQRSNGNIISNNRIIENRRIGIYLEYVYEENLFSDNEITGSGRSGIELYYCRNVEFINNRISDSGSFSILLNETNRCTFYENQMKDIGFMVHRMYDVDPNIISSNNTVNDMPVYYYTGNGATWSVPDNTGQAVIDGCSNLKIENIGFDNITYPIVVSKARNLEIWNCTFDNCGYGAIHLYHPSVTTIAQNNFTGGRNGIVITNRYLSLSQSINLDFNRFTSIGGVGMKVRALKGLHTEGNRFENCKYGFHFDHCNNLSMKKDLFIDCHGAGIYMDRNDYNRITESTFLTCNEGIREADDCHKNLMSFNMFKDCTGPAIHLSPQSYSDRIYNNAFLLNNGTGDSYIEGRPQVKDEGGKGKWFNPDGTGNHWHDLRGPDSDSDGRVDVPYDIENNNSDEYPITEMHLQIASPPTYPGAQGFKGYVLVGWREPEETRRMPVISYHIYRSNETMGEEPFATVSGLDTYYNDTDVENDVTYTYRIQAETAFGKGEITGPFTATPDGTPPSLAIIYPGNRTVINESSIMIEWEAGDAIIGSGLKYVLITLDGGEPLDVTGSDTLKMENLTGGEHTIFIEASDIVGNHISLSRSFIVDLDDPSVSIEAPLNGSLLNTESLMIVWNGSDRTSGIRNYTIKTDNGPWVDVGTNKSMYLSNLTEGKHSIHLKVVDLGGNTNMTSVSFRIDHTPPVLTLLSPSNGSFHKLDRVLVNWSATDGLSGLDRVRLFVDGNLDTVDLILEEFYVEDLDEGKHNITVEAMDLAGNVKSITVTIYIDTIPPRVIDYHPRGSSVSVGETVSVSFSEPMNWDSISITFSNAPIAFEREGLTVNYVPPSPLLYGTEYDVRVSGLDLAGNTVSMEWSFETDGNGSVRGRLVTESGSSISGARIILNEEEMDITNENGYFMFNVSYGTYNLILRADGYEEKVAKAVINAGKTTDIGEMTMIAEDGGPADDDEEEDKDEGLGSITIVLIIAGIIVLLVVIVIIFIIARKSGSSGEDVGIFERAEGLRDLADRRGIDIDDLEPDYKNALYQRDIGDIEDSEHSMKRYVEDLEKKLEE